MAAGLYVGWQEKIVHDRRQLLNAMLARGGIGYSADNNRVIPPDGPEPPAPHASWLRRMLGDRAVAWIVFPKDATTEEKEEFKSLFPETEIKQGRSQ